jgi:Mn2+/Fe2+ NRAMP family transporter
MNSDVQKNLQAINEARAKGKLATIRVYLGLAGPGWLQSAITLGGGSLAGSLYLGILAGTSMLWLQPLAMIFGIIMLSAISYVTLSTGEPPFQTVRKHISPILAWGWLAATVVANLVWSLP